jgi:1,4-dihydroxy-2-naphthoate polyprenyltransferase
MTAAHTPGAPPPWRVWLAAARPRTLPAAVAPVLVGSALALRDGRFGAWAAADCLVFALLIQIGTNFANDYYDFVHGADHGGRVGPTRAVAAGWVAPAAMRRAMWAVFAAAFLVGLALVARGGPWLLVIGIASIVCGIAYTGGPYPLGYHGLGDLFVFVFFGLVAVGATYYVQAGRVSAAALLAAVPIGLLAANILLVNNYRDAETDAAAGKRTLVVRFGRGFARAQYGTSLAVALAVPAAEWARGGGWASLLPLALAPRAWSLARRLRTRESAPERIRLLGDTAQFLAAYAVLFALGAVLGAAR